MHPTRGMFIHYILNSRFASTCGWIGRREKIISPSVVWFCAPCRTLWVWTLEISYPGWAAPCLPIWGRCRWRRGPSRRSRSACAPCWSSASAHPVLRLYPGRCRSVLFSHRERRLRRSRCWLYTAGGCSATTDSSTFPHRSGPWCSLPSWTWRSGPVWGGRCARGGSWTTLRCMCAVSV